MVEITKCNLKIIQPSTTKLVSLLVIIAMGSKLLLEKHFRFDWRIQTRSELSHPPPIWDQVSSFSCNFVQQIGLPPIPVGAINFLNPYKTHLVTTVVNPNVSNNSLYQQTHGGKTEPSSDTTMGTKL